jgi:polysaccharide biosynthesis/export protein
MVKFCVLVALTATLLIAADSTRDEQPPKELVGYISDAKKLGLADDQIRRNAVTAGWDEKLFDAALSAIAQGTTSMALPANSGVPDDYVIGIGDVLQISVWHEPDASVPLATVRPDGKISVPLLKEIEIAGLSPTAAEKKLADGLSRYIHNADVTVIIREMHSRKAYLVGGVRTVGLVELRRPITILQALTEAGGITDYAKRKQIYVLRTVAGRQTKLPFNYDAVIKGENIEQNIFLMPNDTVVVPQ